MSKSPKKRRDPLSIILLVIICISLVYLVKSLYDYKSDNDYYSNVRESAQTNSKIDFDSLEKENSDIVGWITIKGTRIDYPIVQTNDNDKYLHTLFNNEPGGAGCIFADYRREPFKTPFTIIYGHRMKDGSMFNNLKKYKDQSFAEKHQDIKIYTPEKDYKFNIVLFAILKASDDVYQENFTNAIDAYKMLKGQALYQYDDVGENDRLVMLSTCTYEFNNARYVLIGKLQ